MQLNVSCADCIYLFTYLLTVFVGTHPKLFHNTGRFSLCEGVGLMHDISAIQYECTQRLLS